MTASWASRCAEWTHIIERKAAAEGSRKTSIWAEKWPNLPADLFNERATLASISHEGR